MSSLDTRLGSIPWMRLLPAGLVAVTAIVLGGAVAWLGSDGYILVLGALGIVAILIVGLRYERVPFYVLVASLALGQILTVEELPTTLMIVPGSLAIAVWLARLAVRRTSVVIDRRAMSMAILIGFWATLSALNAGGMGAARSYWLIVILFLLTPNVIRKEKHFVELGWVLALSLGVVGGIVLFTQAQAYLSGIATSGQLLHRYAQQEVAFGVSGILGMRLTKAIPFALYIAFAQRGIPPWQRYLLVLSAILISLAILSTVSLSAIFALTGTFLLAVLWVREHTQRFWVILVVSLVLLAGSSLLLEPVAERVTEQIVTVEQEDPLSWGTHRGRSWYVGLLLIQQSPLLGHGPGAADEASLIYTRELVTRATGTIPHNFLLSLGTEIGIPGMLLFAALGGVITVSLWREVRRQQVQIGDKHSMTPYMGRAILIGLVMLMAQGMGIPVHLDKYLWLLLGTAVAFVHMSERIEPGAN